MKIAPKIFETIECLTETSKERSVSSIHKKWFSGLDKRYTSQSLQKFLDINKERFDFLEVTPLIQGSENSLSLSFRSSKFIGAVSLKSPETGKLLGDFYVYPKYISSKDRFVEYAGLIDLIGQEIQPQYLTDVPLNSDFGFSPPKYIESVKFIDLLYPLTSRPWRKFKSIQSLESQFKGDINWKKFIEKEYNPQLKFKVPTKVSTLSNSHFEYSQIKHVFELARTNIFSNETPPKIKHKLKPKIQFIELKLAEIQPIKTVGFQISQSDNLFIKSIKMQANAVLDHNKKTDFSWRIDFSQVFERLVQHVFKQASNEIGADFYGNFSIPRFGTKRHQFELSRLEPDIMVSKENNLYFADAKYKSHLFNVNSDSIYLKEEFRKDVHQILAYASFGNTKNKKSFLCYPSYKTEESYSWFYNPLTGSESVIYIIGIPINKDKLGEVKEMVKELILKEF